MTVSDTSDLEQRLARQREKAKEAEQASVGEIIDYVKEYAKQETLGPLKGAGAWLGWGFAAAGSLGLGLVLILIGLLRLLQTEWERSATGSLSWLSYLIVLIAAGIVLAITLMRSKKATLHKEPKSGACVMAKKSKTAPNTTTKITPQDIENRLKALQGDVQGKVDDKKSTIASTAAAGGMVLLVIFFLLGRRSGKKRSAVVEIRRI